MFQDNDGLTTRKAVKNLQSCLAFLRRFGYGMLNMLFNSV